MRTIIHLDLDAFFCAVEEQRDGSLRGVPFAVGGLPAQRGVVASCSYAARAFGVRSAMPMARAVAQCPGLLVVPPDFYAYRQASQAVMERLHALTPLVEQLSIDEAFLDVSALDAVNAVQPGDQPGEALARRLQAQIATELGLACSLGVASNKLVAKVASDVGKSAAKSGTTAAPPDRPYRVWRAPFGFASPCAICVVVPGREAEFLAPLPASSLWGVGPKTAERLASFGLLTIGHIAAWPEAELTRFFGRYGSDLWRRAQGIDTRPVEVEHETKSISHETTFEQDVRDGVFLRQTIHDQAVAVGRKLRRKNLRGTTVRLKIRWPDFTTPTRQLTLTAATDADEQIATAALRLFEQIWDEGQPVRLIGVGVSGLGTAPRQLSLWDAPLQTPAQQQKVRAALEAVRSRLGAGAVRRASEIDPDEPT